MKTMKKYLSIAALALVGAVMTGCSNNDNAVLPVSYDNVQQPVNNEKIVTLKTTISLDNNNATTRALAVDFDQKKAIKTFAAGDQIAVFYKDGSNHLRLATSNALTNDDIHNDGKTANFTITCPEPGEGAAVRYVYPASMAKGTIQATDEITDANTIDYSRLEHQTGSLYDLGTNYDLATFDGNFSGTSLPASAPLTNRLAILALTLKKSDGSSNITRGLSSVTVIGSNSKTYNVASGMYSFGTDTIYVAIQPEDDETALKIAALGSNRYGKTLTARAYKADNFYNMSMRMLPTIWSLTVPTVGQVIGDNGNIYNLGDKPSSVTAVAVIAYVGSETGHDTYKNGLAIALSDEARQMDWSTAMTTCAAHTPVFSNGTWVLPSSYQWSQMFRANGGSDATWSGLDATITNANGLTLDKIGHVFDYWTSTNYNTSDARKANFSNEKVVSDAVADKTNTFYVRACLVF